jgi:cell division protein FtsW (lipid II flippase)
VNESNGFKYFYDNISSKALTVFVLILWSFWGCYAIYSATERNMLSIYAPRHLMWTTLSAIMFYFIVTKISYKFLQTHWLKLFIAALFFLFGVLFLGSQINGMRGWYHLSICYIQPSELIKPIFILSLSRVAAIYKEDSKRILYLSIITGIFCSLIFLQPDFGTMLVLILSAGIVFYLSNFPYIYYLILKIICILVAVFIYLKFPHVQDRVNGFFNREAHKLDSSWQMGQCKISIASGGLQGKGLGNANWSNNFLPYPYSDSAYASFSEALGLMGTGIAMGCFLILFYFSYNAALKVKDIERKIFILSASSLILIQAFIHASVNLGLFPTTGITLPIFSYGGSSLLSTYIMIAFMYIASDEKNEVNKIKEPINE